MEEPTSLVEKKTLTLKKKETRPVLERDHIHQSFARGRSKTVEVEVKRKRTPASLQDRPKETLASAAAAARGLTGSEFDSRMRAVKESLQQEIATQKAESLLAKNDAAKNYIIESDEVKSDEIPDDQTSLGAASSLTKSDTVIQTQEPSVSTQPDIATTPEPIVAATPPSAKTAQNDGKRYQEWRNQPGSAATPSKARDTQTHRGMERKELSQTFTTKRDQNRQKETPRDDARPIVLSAYGAKPPVKSTVVPDAPVKDLLVIDPLKKDVRVQKVRRKANEEEESANDSKKIKIEPARKLNRTVLTRALDDDDTSKRRSVASMKRARQKHHKQQHGHDAEALKISREVIIPETLTVSELSNRMAVRGSDVVKALMKLGMMVTINQVIDADTAELICGEFGHTPKRVSDADIEIGLGHHDDTHEDLIFRAPVVTIMGHVDHGKTSLLDALRETDVAGAEAGGITQHIGAYQITLASNKKITFIDTPGHAAFSEMRARGANVTDIVVLVVAADDGIMDQTIEAIHHAKAAQVPIVVAINKIDKPDADSTRIRHELLQHEVVLEEFGGDVIAVEVSAKKRLHLDKLEEAILLQAEVLDLKANPHRKASGVVVEAKIDKGRGTVATVLIQKGTLAMSDVFVAGAEWGRVKAMIDSHGVKMDEAVPSMPVEILGFNGVPQAGDEFFVVENEQRAREIAEYRHNRMREKETIVKTKGGMENIMSRIVSGESHILPLVIKADVQGSLEAITASLNKLATDEVSVRILHGAVGGINESDITLAKASNGFIVGFNVRANLQAREIAKRDGVEIRYYSIIYNIIDEVKALMGGLLSPLLSEKYLGTAEIRNVFNLSNVDGKVAGCYILDGTVKRGAKVRVIRDSIVIFEGELKSLKRFKDEVKEVKENYECGMAFDGFDNMKVDDRIECFEIESTARKL